MYTWCFRTTIKTSIARLTSCSKITRYAVTADFITIWADFTTCCKTNNKIYILFIKVIYFSFSCMSCVLSDLFYLITIYNNIIDHINYALSYLFEAIGSGQAHIRQS